MNKNKKKAQKEKNAIHLKVMDDLKNRYGAKYAQIKKELIEKEAVREVRPGYHRTSPDFINDFQGIVRADPNDNWYPNLCRHYIGFVVVPTGMFAYDVPFGRFVGGDDFDMGRDFSSNEELFAFFDNVPEVVSQEYLKERGFFAGH